MKTVEVKFEATGAIFSVSIDGKKLQFVNGTATRSLAGGKEYTIQWFVQGAPGTKYKVQITKPAEAKFSQSATLDGTGKDAGVFWFTLDGGAA